MIEQGDVIWADLGNPTGSEPGYLRPLVVVQAARFNTSGLPTLVCVGVTGNLRFANLPGNVLLRRSESGLPRESVANITQLLTVDRRNVTDSVGRIGRSTLDRILDGIELLIGR